METPNHLKTFTQLKDDQLKWPHVFYQWLCVRIMGFYFWKDFSLTVYGRENIPKEWMPFVVASNHVSSLDPPLVSYALDFRPVIYLAKVELFEKPLMRLYNWGMSSIAVNRQKLELSTVKSALKVLKHGKWALGIFPEGTRKKADEPETIGSPKRGVAYFASAAKVGVLPIGIAHAERVDSQGNKIRKPRISVRVGPMVPTDDQLDRFSESIQQAIQTQVLLAKADLEK